MKKKAFITGASGQDGLYLMELLLNKGYEVHGMIRRSSQGDRIKNITAYIKSRNGNIDNLFLHYGNILDANILDRLINEIMPDEIYNLAAQTHVHESFKQPLYTINTNAGGFICLLEIIRLYDNKKDKKTQLFQPVSSEIFGNTEERPQSETTAFHPQSPYACSKVYNYWQAINYREAYNMFICQGILFNHESPRRSEEFVTRKITRAATRIKLKLQDKLYLGNLDAKRDWGFSGDYVEAIWLMMQQPEPDEYVIATGETHSIRDFIIEAFSLLDLDWKMHVEIDEKYFRPLDVNYLLGDPAKAKNKLGWKPRTSFKVLVKIMIEHDLQLAEIEKTTGLRGLLF